MARAGRLTTTVSTKGQVILPKGIRDRRRWDAGTRLVVEDTADGVLLKPAPLFEPAAVEADFASLPFAGKAKSFAEMDAAIAARRGAVRAIDTNVLVRFLTGDEPRQAARARRLIEAGDIFVATTVLLEAEGVLRSAYGFAPARIAAALRGFAGLPGVALEDAALAAQALDWAEKGVDFADALHLGRAQGCDAFMSFDRGLAKAAAGMTDVRVMAP